MSLFRRAWMLAMLVLLAVPALALAAGTAPSPVQILGGKQLWVIIIGAIVPLVTYVLNHVGPWLTEPIKAAVLVIVAAAAGALYTALATNVLGWNTATLELILSAVAAALMAHNWLWKPSGIAALLGAGTNRQAVGPRRRRSAGAPPSQPPGA